MDSETLYSIGELSRRSGLPVKTIRFYSGLGTDPEFAALMRSILPELPDDPAPEQVETWAERYWLLLATVNGRPASSTLAPVHPWFTELAA
ncbi:hypothetical protein AB0F20_03935 [Streptomyces goshikiensis]